MSAPLGSFRVGASAAEVAAFRRATGLAEGPALPLTFPIRWMVAPDVRAAILALVTEPDLVLVHESQSFDYRTPLSPGITYTLELTGRRAAAPDRLFVDGRIADETGRVCAEVETILRLFSTAAAAA